MNIPEVGDRVSYYGRFDNVVSGILAERAISPLTGNPRYRIVDSWQEVSDVDAGRWVGIEEVIGIDPSAIDVETGRTGSGLNYAQHGEFRIVRYQEGGWEQFFNVDGNRRCRYPATRIHARSRRGPLVARLAKCSP